MPKALSEHDVLLMLGTLVLFVGLARLFGDLVARLRQPQVLGELLAGVVLGPSLLGLISHPALRIVGRGSHILEPVSWIGIILLLALTGMETDFASLRREAGPALLTSLGGVITPLIAGFALGMVLPQSLVGSGGSRLAFAAFLALAMSISAVTVIAKVLNDLGQMRRTAAKIILTGGVFDETLGWILLALISGVATGATHGAHEHATLADALGVIVRAAAFLVGAALFGRRLVGAVMRVVRDNARIDHATFTATVVLAIAFAAVTEALGLHQILGAFVFGVIAGTVPRIDRGTIDRIAVVTRGLLVPVFFLFAGLKVDLTQLGHRDVLLIAAAFIGIAILGKIVGCAAGGLIAKMPLREALLVGVGMSARGSMEIVVAVLGLNLGILSPTIFSVIVLLSVVTVLVIPPALRFAFALTPPSEDERARIAREEEDERAYTPRLRRVLVPLLPGAPAEVGAEAARALARSKANAAEPLEIVLLRLEGAKDGTAAPLRPAEERLVRETEETKGDQPIEIEQHVVPKQSPVDAIREAMERGGFQLAIVGVATPRRANALFGPVVNHLISDAPCDVFVVSSAVAFEIDRVKRIVVPFTGRESAHAAGDLALALGSGLGASVHALDVLQEVPLEGAAGIEQLARRSEHAAAAIEELRERAQRLSVPFTSDIRTAPAPGPAILHELAAPQYDLCILGVTDQSRRGTPFFGDTADLLLRFAPTPVGLLVVKSG